MASRKKKYFPIFLSSILLFQISSFPLSTFAEKNIDNSENTAISTGETEKQASIESPVQVTEGQQTLKEQQTTEEQQITDEENADQQPVDESTKTTPEEHGATNPTESVENETVTTDGSENADEGITTNEGTTANEGTNDNPSVEVDESAGNQVKKASIQLNSTQISYQGIALQNPTYVYSSASTSSKTLKSYSQGSILKYKSYTSNWYEATVYVNGEEYTGYIYKAHVENLDLSNQVNYKGIALDNPTKVYKKASTSSGTWKSYASGTILHYRSFANNWYEATVFVDGKWQTGYIYKNHVENANTSNQTTYKGIALQSPTKVFKSASTSSSALKSYAQGSILHYRSFANNWYEATVFVDGKWQTGYIYKNHVENANTSNQTTYKGIALQSPTKVFKSASTSSSALKSYTQGSILQYRSFANHWYEATVFKDGKWQTGYIYKNHVENATQNQQEQKGIALLKNTAVYSAASTSSKKLKTYAAGKILNFKTFSSNWYEATVYLDGKKTLGYINKAHVEQLASDYGKSLQGLANSNPTKVYAGPGRDFNVLKSYAKFTLLKFKTLTKNWYEATVYIDGTARTGYINVADISTDDVINNSKISLTFDNFINMQMKANPKSDGAGLKVASREEVEYYANPGTFSSGSPEFFQFLILSGSANISATEINNKILTSSKAHGLAGQGEAFVKAANYYNMNVIYLIAHALHETGNGTSTLAKGVPVDKNGNVVSSEEDANYYKTVYNVFGYGATDGAAVKNGAKTAFNSGWFTVYDAIVGGISNIANNYINAGQNTLYKIRWNPEGAAKYGYANHQYATHVQWATIIAKKMYSVYSDLDNVILAFEIPKFTNQPSSGNTTFGIVTLDSGNLNLRMDPSTSSKSLALIPNGTKIEIVDQTSTKGWYKAVYNGIIGWVSSDYVSISK